MQVLKWSYDNPSFHSSSFCFLCDGFIRMQTLSIGSQKTLRSSRPVSHQVKNPPERKALLLEGSMDSDKTKQHTYNYVKLAIATVIVREILEERIYLGRVIVT